MTKKENRNSKSSFTLLHKMKGCYGLYFPIGRIQDGGTCEFATETCLAQCYAKRQTYPSLDEQEHVLELVNLLTVKEIVDVICHEMVNKKTRIMHWFATGDCTSELTWKISEVMRTLSLRDLFYQCGFTRNIVLWERVKEFDRLRLALTVEKQNQVPQDTLTYRDSQGLIAMPDYKSRCTELYFNKKKTYACACPTYELKKLTVQTNCNKCLSERIGCWVNI